jgi:hemerythrin-like metal-binding protein
MSTDLARIRFGPSFRTGNTLIDDQHQVLFDLIERVDECLSCNGASASAQRQTVDDLMHYAIYHLTYEERLVARLGCEVELRTHALAHDEFRHRVNHFRDASDRGGPGPGAAELQAYLKDWLVRHILHGDIPLFRKIQQQSSAIAG